MLYFIRSKTLIWTFLVLIAASFAGCNQHSQRSTVKRPNLFGAPTSIQPASQSLHSAKPGTQYRVGPGDRLDVKIFGEPSLTGQYSVDGAGNISMPLISTVQVGARTTPQIAQEITRRLRNGFLRNPAVAVEVLRFRPFFILGEVRRAGQYPYIDGMNVQMAIAVAGGYSERARKSKVKVTRKTKRGTEKLNLNRTDPVLPGDTIFVTERFF